MVGVLRKSRLSKVEIVNKATSDLNFRDRVATSLMHNVLVFTFAADLAATRVLKIKSSLPAFNMPRGDSRKQRITLTLFRTYLSRIPLTKLTHTDRGCKVVVLSQSEVAPSRSHTQNGRCSHAVLADMFRHAPV